jgi:hypothetical protein
MLAARTKTCGSSGNHTTSDSRFAASDAFLPGTVVHAVLSLKPAFVAVDSNVLRIVQRAAALLDCIIQNVMYRRKQTLAGCGIEPRRQSIMPKSCAVENLVCVDVADARDAALVEQECLQVAPPTAKSLSQCHLVEPVDDGVWPESRKFGRHSRLVGCVKDHDFPERTWVDKPHFVPHVLLVRRKMHHYVGVRRSWCAWRNDEHSPAHSQVHHQDAAGVKVAQQVFSASSCGGDTRTAQTVNHCLTALTAHGAFAKHFDALDDPVHGAALDAAANSFNFGKLWHD